MAHILNDVSLHRHIGGAPASEEQLRARSERPVRELSPDGLKRWLNWTVRLRSSGSAVESMQATVSLDDRCPIAALAWVIATPFQGRGLATEAARSVAQWLAEQRIGRLRAPHPSATRRVEPGGARHRSRAHRCRDRRGAALGVAGVQGPNPTRRCGLNRYGNWTKRCPPDRATMLSGQSISICSEVP